MDISHTTVVSSPQKNILGGGFVSAVEQSVDEFQTWYASEVPSIVTGLEGTQSISASTADVAWRLIDDGAYDQALSLVMGEVF